MFYRGYLRNSSIFSYRNISGDFFRIILRFHEETSIFRIFPWIHLEIETWIAPEFLPERPFQGFPGISSEVRILEEFPTGIFFSKNFFRDSFGNFLQKYLLPGIPQDVTANIRGILLETASSEIPPELSLKILPEIYTGISLECLSKISSVVSSEIPLGFIGTFPRVPLNKTLSRFFRKLFRNFSLIPMRIHEISFKRKFLK